METILPISLKLHLTPNILGCYWLIGSFDETFLLLKLLIGFNKNDQITLFPSFNFIPKIGMGLPKTEVTGSVHCAVNIIRESERTIYSSCL